MAGESVVPHASSLRLRVTKVDEALTALYGDPQRLGRSDPLRTLVLTILSQNTNDKNRDRAFSSLRQTFPTWEAVLSAPRRKVEAAIRSGGLARQKSGNIRALLAWVKKRFGKLDLSPLRKMTDREIRDLLSPLKGIGPKTLSILLLFALGREAFPVDTHCLRVLTRLAVLPPGTSATKAHTWMEVLVLRGRSFPLHLNLIRFGRERCHARSPRCRGCPLTRWCRYPDKKRA
ncbi:MAG: endonuclease III domain-containing protein [Planctomycetota bacterium]|jgi:endonuclease-3